MLSDRIWIQFVPEEEAYDLKMLWTWMHCFCCTFELSCFLCSCLSGSHSLQDPWDAFSDWTIALGVQGSWGRLLLPYIQKAISTAVLLGADIRLILMALRLFFQMLPIFRHFDACWFLKGCRNLSFGDKLMWNWHTCNHSNVSLSSILRWGDAWMKQFLTVSLCLFL